MSSMLSGYEEKRRVEEKAYEERHLRAAGALPPEPLTLRAKLLVTVAVLFAIALAGAAVYVLWNWL